VRRLLAAAATLALACATVGRNFDATQLGWLKDGETTKAQILDKLGQPWRVGYDAGDQTWTYGYYEYRALSDSNTKDLVLHFTADGKLKTYTLNTSFPSERAQLDPGAATPAAGK
jgi:outer membrane protein assembly factor BamE (lipoprotein component of BamABCDE complex)